jgi:hypothetical protein
MNEVMKMTNITFPFPVYDMFIDPNNAENDGRGNYVFITPKYQVAHEVAAPANTPAVNFIKNANRPDAPANFHEIVDVNGVYRALPIEKGKCAFGWHALHHANMESFGIEMAHYTNEADFRKAYDIYCARHAYWLLVNDWDISHLKTHHEVTIMYENLDHGDHTDPDNYFQSYGISPAQFKQDVEKWMQKLQNSYRQIKVLLNGKPIGNCDTGLDVNGVTHIIWSILDVLKVKYQYKGNGLFVINGQQVQGIVYNGNSYIPWSKVGVQLEAQKINDGWNFVVKQNTPAPQPSQPVTPIQPKKEDVPMAEQWQIDIMNQAKKLGIINGDHNPLDNAPKWFVLQVVMNALKLNNTKDNGDKK